jgi:2-(1,2-epoxy-1,2-dihydrophenyl)acetyl-CoA isomerase
MTTTASGVSTEADPSTEVPAARFELRDAVAVVTLHRPESHNALSPALLSALSGALSKAADAGAHALVLGAAGKTFCAGGDLAAVSEVIDGDLDTDLGAIVDQLHALIAQLRSLPMPTVVALDGAAIGAGVALALAADVRVIGASATFMTGYLAVGSSPDGGSSFHLSRSLGTNQAISAFLLNRAFDSAELMRRGLADEVVDDGAVDQRAFDLATALTSISPDALVAMRELVYAAPSRGLDEQLDAERARFLSVAHTEGFRRGIARFARNRPSTA